MNISPSPAFTGTKATGTPADIHNDISHLASLFQKEAIEAEHVADQLDKLLVRYASLSEGGGNASGHIKTLQDWIKTYREGIVAAGKISENATAWLSDLGDRTKLAAEELQRLESEGGTPVTNEQVTKTEKLIAIARQTNEIVPEIKHMLGDKEHPKDQEH